MSPRHKSDRSCVEDAKRAQIWRANGPAAGTGSLNRYLEAVFATS